MSRGIYVAMSGAVAQSEALDIVAHNVSNAGSSAPRHRATFKEVLVGGKEGGGVTVDRTTADPRRGALEPTGRKLDLALSGDGFVAVDTADGVRFTRGGSFTLDASGSITDAAGNRLRVAGGGRIDLHGGAEALDIGRDGRLFVGETEIGQIELVDIPRDALVADGSSRFRATAEVRPARADVEIVSGHLEKANGNVIADMVDLVRVSRTYEALTRMIENYKQIDERTAREIGST